MSTDTAVVQKMKLWLPQPAKDVVESGIRWGAAATAPLRPTPDFLVVGTKRGGTTTLWNTLMAHPQVQPMVPAAKHLKSPHYFYWHHGRGDAWYRGHFPTAVSRARHTRLHGGSVVGEASPMYLFDPRVPARVAALMPDVRILITLRDPVQRALSHWKERVKQGAESLPFGAALAAEEGRLAGELERMETDPGYYSRALDWYSYRSRGHYAEQLQQWFRHVDRDRILVLRTEDLYDDQPGTLHRVHDFLGLSPHEAAPQWHNRTRQVDIDPAVRLDLENHFTPHNNALARLLDTEPWWTYPSQNRTTPCTAH